MVQTGIRNIEFCLLKNISQQEQILQCHITSNYNGISFTISITIDFFTPYLFTKYLISTSDKKHFILIICEVE